MGNQKKPWQVDVLERLPVGTSVDALPFATNLTIALVDPQGSLHDGEKVSIANLPPGTMELVRTLAADGKHVWKKTQVSPRQSGDFQDLNGILCSIQKSSLATDDAIWLGVHPTPSEHEKRGYGPARMHLNRQHVAALLPLLQHFVDTGELPQAGRGDNE